MEKEETQEPGICSKNKKGGVYQIVNKLNGMIYIGSSKNLERRWRQHKNYMIRGRHSNKHLQNEANKLKKQMNISKDTLDEFFYFGCLEYHDNTEQRLKVEEMYISILYDSGRMCYNHQKFTNPRGGYVFKNPESTRKKKSIATKIFWRNPQNREKMSINRKKLWENDEYRKKIINSINSPKSRKQHLENFKLAFKRPETKRKLNESRIRNGQIKPFFLINEAGTIIYIENYSKWSKEHKFQTDYIKEIRDGRRAQHKGYKLFISPQSVSIENQKFFNISKMANLYVINCDKHLYILSDKTYRENAMRKIQNL